MNFSGWMLRPITKQIFLSGMPMKIKIKLNPPMTLPSDPLYKLAQRSNFREHKLIQPIKLPIKIFTTIASSKIASNNTVRVEHGYNIEHKHRS